MNELHSILDALDIAVESLEGESERTEKEGFPDEAERERIKAQNFRELKRSLVIDKIVSVKAEDMK